MGWGYISKEQCTTNQKVYSTLHTKEPPNHIQLTQLNCSATMANALASVLPYRLSYWQHLFIYTVYIYIYIYTHTHTHTYIHTYIYIYVASKIYIYMCVCVCVYTHTHTYTHICKSKPFWSHINLEPSKRYTTLPDSYIN